MQNFMSYQLQQMIMKIKIIHLNGKQNNSSMITLFSNFTEKFSSLPHFPHPEYPYAKAPLLHLDRTSSGHRKLPLEKRSLSQ